MTKAEERSAARDFVMARLAACRGALAAAAIQLDVCLEHFIDTEGDEKGKERGGLLKSIDEDIGIAAVAIQAAQSLWEEVDPEEEEPDLDDDDEDEDDDEPEDEEAEEEDEKPKRRRR